MWIPTTQESVQQSTLVADQALGGTVATIDFTSLPQNFTHLRAVVLLRTDAASNDIFVRFNNDSGANYDWENQLQQGVVAPTATQGVGSTAITAGYCASSSAAASEYGAYEILFPFYSSTLYLKKTVQQGHVSFAQSAGNIYRIDGGGTWRSTTAINRITFSTNSNYVVNSRVTIYGIM